MKQLRLDRCTVITRKGVAAYCICRNPASPYFNQTLQRLGDYCQSCPMRPDLTAIEDTLPPHKEGRDRPLRFEPDGSIVYEPDTTEPQEINGYQRDPENPHRFTPLWEPCSLRHGIGVRYANCGCINVIMRCNHPEHPKYLDRVSHHDCQQCPLRRV